MIHADWKCALWLFIAFFVIPLAGFFASCCMADDKGLNQRKKDL